MAKLKKDYSMTRGDTLIYNGVITPEVGQTFSTPITSLRFCVKKARDYQDDGPIFFEHNVTNGRITIVSQSSTQIVYSGRGVPADTEPLKAREKNLKYDLELTEGDGRRWTPVGGDIFVDPDVGTPVS